MLGPQIGEHGVDRDTMQPGTEGALTAKKREFLPHEQKGFLRELLGPRGVGGHAQTNRVNATDMEAVQPLKGRHVAFLRAPNDIGLFADVLGHDEGEWGCDSIHISHLIDTRMPVGSERFNGVKRRVMGVGGADLRLSQTRKRSRSLSRSADTLTCCDLEGSRGRNRAQQDGAPT
jgi:hypothetical protein